MLNLLSSQWDYLSYSLNFLKGFIGDYMGLKGLGSKLSAGREYYRALGLINGDARSLDYS